MVDLSQIWRLESWIFDRIRKYNRKKKFDRILKLLHDALPISIYQSLSA